MFFIVDKPKLQRVIGIVRDDRTPPTQWAAGPFLRIEAREGALRLDGLEVSATIPATVYEPGVLFLKITHLRRILAMISGQKMISIQVNGEGLLLDNVTFPLESGDMLLYADPAQAPARHPDDVQQNAQAEEKVPSEPTLWDIQREP